MVRGVVGGGGGGAVWCRGTGRGGTQNKACSCCALCLDRKKLAWKSEYLHLAGPTRKRPGSATLCRAEIGLPSRINLGAGDIYQATARKFIQPSQSKTMRILTLYTWALHSPEDHIRVRDKN